MEPLKGVIHGTSIELSANPGLPDGQQVEVVVTPAKAAVDLEEVRKRLLAFKGVPDWSEEDDRILEEIAHSRKSATWREPTEPGDAG